ncbi:hypothetical protein UFOVP1184_14 [uncultured Caudovirales phage]|uniref:Uncharacterized protein n=1 Tax=uncultured Caudovirales phage TaxID=2100421 RepID=A0A6J5QZS2_9CAUD|nr:hypothetical protein UFOVP1184_14 [uncultured Caudovirales phage]
MSFTDTTVIAGLAAHLSAKSAPTGYTLRQVHTYPPDNLPVVPACVLIPGDDAVNYGASNRQILLTINATIYIQPQADLGRKYADLMAWRTWLRDSLIDGVTLDGTDAVAQASVVSTTMGTDTWAEQDYLTISALIEVSSVEAISASA